MDITDAEAQALRADMQPLIGRLKKVQNNVLPYKICLTVVLFCFAAYILFDLKEILFTRSNPVSDWEEEVHKCQVLKEKAEEGLTHLKHEIERLNTAYSVKSNQVDVWKAKAQEYEDSRLKLEEELYQLIDEKQKPQDTNSAMSNQRREKIQSSQEKINLEEELHKAKIEIQRLNREVSVKSNEADAWKQKVYAYEDSKIKADKQLDQMNHEMQQLPGADLAKSTQNQSRMQKINDLTTERDIVDQKNGVTNEESYSVWLAVVVFMVVLLFPSFANKEILENTFFWYIFPMILSLSSVYIIQSLLSWGYLAIILDIISVFLVHTLIVAYYIDSKNINEDVIGMSLGGSVITCLLGLCAIVFRWTFS